ncbi:MAG: hypothetical protein QW607_06965 [Desulfurococcaceae archaeon]
MFILIVLPGLIGIDESHVSFLKLVIISLTSIAFLQRHYYKLARSLIRQWM